LGKASSIFLSLSKGADAALVSAEVQQQQQEEGHRVGRAFGDLSLVLELQIFGKLIKILWGVLYSRAIPPTRLRWAKWKHAALGIFLFEGYKLRTKARKK